MKNGIDIDKCEYERELALKHKHFVETLNRGQARPSRQGPFNTMTVDSARASRSTLAETDRRPPMAPRGSSRLSRPGQSSAGLSTIHESGYMPMHMRQSSGVISTIGVATIEDHRSSRPQLLQLQKIEKEVHEEIEETRRREAYKPPSKNTEVVLEHFYRLQKNELARLGKFDLEEFATNCYVRRLKLKAISALKASAFQKSQVARTLAALKRKKKVFVVLRNMGRQRMKRNAREKQMREIYQLFKTKKILRAWRKIITESKRLQMIGERKRTQTFCVKYSDYCKCRKCEQ